MAGRERRDIDLLAMSFNEIIALSGDPLQKLVEYWHELLRTGRAFNGSHLWLVNAPASEKWLGERILKVEHGDVVLLDIPAEDYLELEGLMQSAIERGRAVIAQRVEQANG